MKQSALNKFSAPFLLVFVAHSVGYAQKDSSKHLSEVVVSGQMKAVTRSASIVPVELLGSHFFKKNPSPSLFDAVGQVNGVQSQVSCNVCNAGNIQINGMEGPYTMVLIDGMPIVSALSSVYGLSGIPNSIIDRVEIVKGPASSLYGSEAMGGIINVITKDLQNAPTFFAEMMGTSWGEWNADLSGKLKWGKGDKMSSLIGVSHYNFDRRTDKNKDGFTDISLQKRWSVFNKWSIQRPKQKIASLALRYVFEDRWGGQTNWTKSYRGGDSIYGEHIETKRWEIIGQYQWPTREKIMSQISYNWHTQDAAYGQNLFQAGQQVFFGQNYWDKDWNQKHNSLLGIAARYTTYDDSTVGTPTTQKTILPGVFAQHNWSISTKTSLLLGYRLDFHQQHKWVHSPRFATKWQANDRNIFRLSAGTGFRVVNLFTEDHAALSGARDVVIKELLNPERSYNTTLNYTGVISQKTGPLEIDASAFYTYFTNKIVGDYDSDPQKIIYQNIKGNALSRGLSINLDKKFKAPLRISLGVSYIDVLIREDIGGGQLQTKRQLHAPQWSGNFLCSYKRGKNWTFDVTARYYGPMRLPILPNDHRPEFSPWYCIANIQALYKVNPKCEFYGGLKNILNFVPRNPIMRPFDPFDKQANDPITNPNGYSFDPSYNYASLQGIRIFLGCRYSL